jgi:alpha-L-fucosidase
MSVPQPETPAQRAERMKWWKEARFGMFIHWGLYAVPAGKWGTNTGYGEWIRDSAHIPIGEYEKFQSQFNPVEFDARKWVRIAKDAGMKYIVITSKHHDGFCLFDSKHTDWDVMNTPFHRDIMKELAEACRREGIRMCWYHSIMDWHHPDYLPRRPWEVQTRPAGDADMDKYVAYLRNQVTELLTNYGPIGVMWFDGEWESTWNHKYGKALYDLCRSLQPNVIVNNRVDVGREGMGGFSDDTGRAGDFGTPEQEIPATGMPGIDWETCMTMNNNWGYNAVDKNFKSTRQLLRMLVDIASKGGNYLLNVGPTSSGNFPDESVARLREIGRWMKTNGESIYGTEGSVFKELDFGRCTVKRRGKNTVLYLHVFDWPKSRKLVVPGIGNEPVNARLLATSARLPVSRSDSDLVIDLPASAPDSDVSTVAFEVRGEPIVYTPPTFVAVSNEFVSPLQVVIDSKLDVRYTVDGSEPISTSRLYREPITIAQDTTIKARGFHKNKPVTPVASFVGKKVVLWVPAPIVSVKPGILCEVFKGNWDKLPDFSKEKHDSAKVTALCELDSDTRKEYLALRYTGYLRVPQNDMYLFSLGSDDGSKLYIDEKLIIDNDGLHSFDSKRGSAPLAAGIHRIRIEWFNKTGGAELALSWAACSKADPQKVAFTPISAGDLGH